MKYFMRKSGRPVGVVGAAGKARRGREAGAGGRPALPDRAHGRGVDAEPGRQHVAIGAHRQRGVVGGERSGHRERRTPGTRGRAPCHHHLRAFQVAHGRVAGGVQARLGVPGGRGAGRRHRFRRQPGTVCRAVGGRHTRRVARRPLLPDGQRGTRVVDGQLGQRRAHPGTGQGHRRGPRAGARLALARAAPGNARQRGRQHARRVDPDHRDAAIAVHPQPHVAGAGRRGHLRGGAEDGRAGRAHGHHQPRRLVAGGGGDPGHGRHVARPQGDADGPAHRVGPRHRHRGRPAPGRRAVGHAQHAGGRPRVQRMAWGIHRQQGRFGQ